MWADNLIAEYEEGRKGLSKMIRNLPDTEQSQFDKNLLNSMARDMTFSIEWLKTGREPENLQGVDKLNAYQKQAYFKDMDLFPTLELEPKKELTDGKKRAILSILMELSGRERQVYILYNAYTMTMKAIAEELEISISSVQTFLERADKKIEKQLE